MKQNLITVSAENSGRSAVSFRPVAILMIIAAALILAVPSSLAQQRWFQVEVSIFSNESPADRAEEYWHPGLIRLFYPPDLVRLNRPMDLLLTDSLLPKSTQSGRAFQANRYNQSTGATDEGLDLQDGTDLRTQAITATGPFPARPSTGFRFFNFAIDSFLQLPISESNFRQTNRALERSPDHRLLFHGLWRQPVENTEQAMPLYVSGGDRYGNAGELEGSLTIRFNDNRDRVVIDTNLWLTQFGSTPAEVDWHLPVPPAKLASKATFNSNIGQDYYPTSVYPMQQSRQMRSTEFHYLDNPALGLVVMVLPYELPVPAPTSFD